MERHDAMAAHSRKEPAVLSCPPCSMPLPSPTGADLASRCAKPQSRALDGTGGWGAAGPADTALGTPIPGITGNSLDSITEISYTLSLPDRRLGGPGTAP